MWAHRNGFKHSQDNPDTCQYHIQLQDRIRHEYNLGTQTLLQSDHHWLQQPIHTIYNYDTKLQEQWLASLDQARIKYHTNPTHEPHIIQMQNTLATWLGQKKIYF